LGDATERKRGGRERAEEQNRWRNRRSGRGARRGLARSLARAHGKKIFEYDYTARVNRPVRKRAASYTRNAFACQLVGKRKAPGSLGMAAWRGDSVARRNGGSGTESGEAPMGPRAKSAKGRLARTIDRAISHHHHHHHHHRGSRAVIYRPYLKSANCLFKHNKTAVPPFNLRGSPFRVRGPCRLPNQKPHQAIGPCSLPV